MNEPILWFKRGGAERWQPENDVGCNPLRRKVMWTFPIKGNGLKEEGETLLALCLSTLMGRDGSVLSSRQFWLILPEAAAIRLGLRHASLGLLAFLG